MSASDAPGSVVGYELHIVLSLTRTDEMSSSEKGLGSLMSDQMARQAGDVRHAAAARVEREALRTRQARDAHEAPPAPLVHHDSVAHDVRVTQVAGHVRRA